jgi:hypothetical protein
MTLQEFKSQILAIFPKENWHFNEPHLEAKSEWLSATVIGDQWIYSNAAGVHGTGNTLREAILDSELKQRQFLLTVG